MASRLALLLWLVVTVSASSATDGSSSSDWQDALVITEYPVESVTSAMANVNFTKYFAVSPPESEPDAVPATLTISAPGRVFVDYVDYQDAGELVNSSTLMLVKVSGESDNLIDLVYLQCDQWLASDGPSVELNLKDLLDDTPERAHLLIEISVLRNSSVRSLAADISSYVGIARSVEVVVGDGVLYSSTDRPNFTTNADGYLQPVTTAPGISESLGWTDIRARGLATVYLVAPLTPFYVNSMTIGSIYGGSIYVDASTIVVAERLVVTIRFSVAVIFANIVETASVSFLDEGDAYRLCLSVSDSFKVGDSYVHLDENTALPDLTAGFKPHANFTCVKAKIPERVPRQFSLSSDGFTRADSTSSAAGSDMGDPDALFEPAPVPSSSSSSDGNLGLRHSPTFTAAVCVVGATVSMLLSPLVSR